MQTLQHLPLRQCTGAAANSASQTPSHPLLAIASHRRPSCLGLSYLGFAGFQLLLSLLVLHGLCKEGRGKQGVEGWSGKGRFRRRWDSKLRSPESPARPALPRPKWKQSRRSLADSPQPHGKRRHRRRRRHLRLHVNTRRGGRGWNVCPRSRLAGRCVWGPAPAQPSGVNPRQAWDRPPTREDPAVGSTLLAHQWLAGGGRAEG